MRIYRTKNRERKKQKGANDQGDRNQRPTELESEPSIHSCFLQKIRAGSDGSNGKKQAMSARRVGNPYLPEILEEPRKQPRQTPHRDDQSERRRIALDASPALSVSLRENSPAAPKISNNHPAGFVIDGIIRIAAKRPRARMSHAARRSLSNVLSVLIHDPSSTLLGGTRVSWGRVPRGSSTRFSMSVKLGWPVFR